MTELQRKSLSELLPGMQLAVFEIIWFAFPWMRSIWIKENSRQVHFFIEVPSALPEQEREDCRRLLKEMLDVAMPGTDHTAEYGPVAPHANGYHELMSDRLFKAIASKVAPWRLDVAVR
jgi:hypothetical protein